MRKPHRQFIDLLVVLCVVASAVAWSAHVEVPSAAAPVVAGEHVSVGDLATTCDHCCHASAHLLALGIAPAGVRHTQAGKTVCAHDARLTAANPDPPFIPPIA